MSGEPTTDAGRPTARGERFECACGGDMGLERIDPRADAQVWVCEDGCTWIRDLTGGDWRRAET